MDGVALLAADGVRQDLEQVGAVQQEVREAVPRHRYCAEIEELPGLARVPQAHFLPGRLARETPQPVGEPERVQHAVAVRAQLQSRADLPELARLLVHVDADAALQQRERRRQPADTGAGDEHVWLRHAVLLYLGMRGEPMSGQQRYAVRSEWVHVKHAEVAAFREVYGFASAGGMVNLEGIRFLPEGVPSKTLLVYMHPASTLQLLPMPRAMAEHGLHVLCAGSRYARNDTPLIMEKVILDLGAYVRHAKEVWGYEKVVIVGWSGGGSLSLLYQAEA